MGRTTERGTQVVLLYSALLSAAAASVWLGHVAFRHRGVALSADETSAALPVLRAHEPWTRYEVPHVVLWADDGACVQPCRLRRFTERTCRETASLTRLPVPEERLLVYLCSSSPRRLEVETRHRVKPAGASGVFYPSVPMAIVQDGPLRETTISHEMVHWIVSNRVPRCPAFVEEGLAVLIAERVVAGVRAHEVGRDPSSIKLRSMYRRERRLRAYLDRRHRDPYSLDDLLRLTVAKFEQRPESRLLFYDLSWCLAVVLEQKGAELGAPLDELLRELGSTRDSCAVVRSLYPRRALDGAWRKKIAEVAAAQD